VVSDDLATALALVIDGPNNKTFPDWDAVLRSTRLVGERLSRPDALVAAFDDALSASLNETPGSVLVVWRRGWMISVP
jgi:hypothetical protein